MSLRLEMIQVARLATSILSDSTSLVTQFVQNRLLEDGGFADRSGRSDLYYTVFGLYCLQSLGHEPPSEKIARFLDQFGSGANLDLVHLTALIQCRSCLGAAYRYPADRAVELLERFRTPDGGFGSVQGCQSGNAYSAFMALNAYQEIERPIPRQDEFVQAIRQLKNEDGSFRGERNMVTGVTTVTAAASTTLHRMTGEHDPKTVNWLLNMFSLQGGFHAIPRAPMPDLLSTATSLHALSYFKTPIEPFVDVCLDFIDSLWVNTGSFYGNWADEFLDVEYTFYALLALGHLAVAGPR